MPPLDLNEDHTDHQFFSTNHQASSSSSYLSYSILFNTDQDQGGSYYWGPKQLQCDEEAEKIVPISITSWDHPAVEKNGNSSDDLKKEEGGKDQNIEGEDMNSMKWMPSKMRILRRMMLSDQTGSCDEKQNSSPPLGTASNNNSSNNINTGRVCADCHTTKTPLWRTGPTGPKHGRVTKKTDVWSLGILILEYLTGKLPANFLPQEMGATKNSEGEMMKLLRIALTCCEWDVDKRYDLIDAVDKIQEVKERDSDKDYYSSFASEADMKSKASSGEVRFSKNG
ncbi:Zinc finger, GATA-type [Sesbania bispinosa]|nr:Zinc finger, GATA-type [Sesbania bispinosa]